MQLAPRDDEVIGTNEVYIQVNAEK